MTITVNGELRTLDSKVTLGAYLDSTGLDRNRIAVERNGELIRRKFFDQTPLGEGDTLEIVTLVGGG